MKKKITKYLTGISYVVFVFSACSQGDTSAFDIIYPDPDDNGSQSPGEEDDDENGPNGPKFPFYAGGGSIAFPGAEGFGKEATGARVSENRTVCRVTNLNASGEGSFAEAISQENRVIVFDVAGIINMNGGTLVLKSNQTILGQTAPGDGIVIYNGRLSSSGAKNLIVRYLRVRLGAAYPSSADTGGAASGNNQIFDHCSFTWGRDENFSLNRDGKNGGLYNITLQNSIIGQGLQNHSCGGLIQTNLDEGVTLFRNLYIDNESRNPKVKGLNQFVNNVVYNWGTGAAYNMGGDSDGDSETTIENNYFIVGLSEQFKGYGIGTGIVVEYERFSPARPFTGGAGKGDFRSYCVGNYYDNNKNGVLDGIELTQTNWSQYCSATPIFQSSRKELFPVITSATNATRAYEWIVDHVGATLPARDQVDAFLIDELTSLGTKGIIIRNETLTEQFPLGGPGHLQSGTPLSDSDGDGIPDFFEDIWGLDKNDPTDAVKIANNGYMNIENYALSLEFPDDYKK